MTDRELMQQALEALETRGVSMFTDDMVVEEAITALREALAEKPAQQEQTDWEAVAADQAMTIALLKVQLEGLPGKEQLPWFKDEIPAAYMYDRARYGPTDLRGQQWLPELSRLKPYTGNGMVRGLTPLYTTPPQRKPLTDEEIDCLYRENNDTPGFNFSGFARRFARAIEAKLKEKNT